MMSIYLLFHFGQFTNENSAFALAEMRGFLESVKPIQEGIVNNDATLVVKAGKKSGGSCNCACAERDDEIASDGI